MFEVLGMFREGDGDIRVIIVVHHEALRYRCPLRVTVSNFPKQIENNSNYKSRCLTWGLGTLHDKKVLSNLFHSSVIVSPWIVGNKIIIHRVTNPLEGNSQII